MVELRILLTALALFAAMVLAGWVGLRQRVGVVILALLSAVWLTVDHDFEGPVLLDIDRSHGLVLSDLVGLVGFAAAAWLWWRSRGR